MLAEEKLADLKHMAHMPAQAVLLISVELPATCLGRTACFANHEGPRTVMLDLTPCICAIPACILVCCWRTRTRDLASIRSEA